MAQDIKPIQSVVQVASKPPDDSLTARALPPAQPPAPEDSAADAVSSLRALALSTMRVKRRKAPEASQSVPVKPLPTRPVPVPPTPSAVILDYGSEDTQKGEDTTTASVPINTNSNGSPSGEPLRGAGDREIREEGEISDEDDENSPGPPAVRANGHDFPSESRTQKFPALQTTPLAPSIPPPMDPQATARTNLTEQHQDGPSITEQERNLWNGWVPDKDHVRPGLQLNMDQFNMVKELILDLLGWGVSPEYLVDCGLTREAVYYTFTELNLRLPKNLDVTGLIPFPPPLDIAAASSLQAQSQTNAQSSMPPPLIIPPRTESSPVEARRQSMGHPLPAKPIGPVGGTPTSPTMSAISLSLSNANEQSLLDMVEAQRKQELQARRELIARNAVLASRKKKVAQAVNAEQTILSEPTSSAVPNTSATSASVDGSSSVAPTEAVVDFLNSVVFENATPHPSPTAALPRPRALSGGVALGIPPVSPVTPDGMDVDTEGIPGFGSHRHQQQHHSLPPKPLSPQESIFPAQGTGGRESSIVPTFLPGPSEMMHTSTSRDSSLLPESVAPIPERPPTRNARTPIPNDSNAPAPITNGKRGTKRPVAMDFVDVDSSAPGLARSATFPMSSGPPHMRRKIGSFAGLNTHISRRCVIDVSDSEEEEEPGGGRKGSGEEDTNIPIQNAPRMNTNMLASDPVISRPPSVIANGANPVSSGVLTPAALMEKEAQIKRIKEQIAQRELLRLRKRAETSRTPAGTPPSFSSGSTLPMSFLVTSRDIPGTPTVLSVPIKLEELDSVPLPTSEGNGEVPDTRSVSESVCDQADEDLVMQNLIEAASVSESILPTPTDVKMNALEHYSTGESVLTAEAVQEQVSPSTATQNQSETRDAVLTMPMDVDLHASSAQTIGVEQRHPSMFTTYSSPFHPYPLLRSRSRVVSDLALETHLLSNSSSSSLFSSSSSATTIGQKTVIPDLRPLRVAVMAREASSDLGRRVCQYEVPGGGVCRDKTCTDMHLSDLDPDDHETARYLIETMPDVLQTYDESEIADQLLQARQKKVCHVKTASQGGSATSTCSLEETVAEAISALVGSGS